MFKRLFALLLLLVIAVKASCFLGADKLWRPRENMLFFLLDEEGGGFELNIALRDMNIYCDGPRPAYLFVIAPDGSVVNRMLIEDDGITRCDFSHRDGMADIGDDIRFRSYQRNTKDPHFPIMPRSQYLDEPEKLPARNYRITVPNAGKGVYRLALVSCWDHWVSITPSRRLKTAIHPGQGPIYLHKRELQDSYIYIHPGVKDIFLATTEEITPFNWRVTADIDGEVKCSTQPKQFYNYEVLKDVPADRILHLHAEGNTAGAMLHLMGVANIFCEDRETAVAIGKNWEEPCFKKLRPYAESCKLAAHLLTFSPALGFQNYDAVGASYNTENNFTIRSSWWSFGDQGDIQEKEKNLPAEVLAAREQLFLLWALNRYTMELTPTCNQWAKILYSMARMYKETNNPIILEALKYNVSRMCSHATAHRAQPYKDCYKSGYEPDCGLLENGIMAENFGHDNGYNLESDADLYNVYLVTRQKEILDYFNEYYRFKSHLTLPKTSADIASPFESSCAPSDFNSRTRDYTHKSPNVAGLCRYGNLWGTGRNNLLPVDVWPYQESEPFNRDMKGRCRIIKSDDMYSIVYTGPINYIWGNWMYLVFDGHSADFRGFHNAGYAQWQHFQIKSGGLSAVWFKGYGPFMVANNHNVMYCNAIWGETEKPYLQYYNHGVNPSIFTDALAWASGTFNEDGTIFTRAGDIPYTDIAFERKVKIMDSRIEAHIKVQAKKDCQVKCLYEAIPFMINDNIIVVNGKTHPLPKPFTTGPYRPLEGEDGFSKGTTKLHADAVQFISTSGYMVEVHFDKAADIITAAPMKYRDVAAPISSLNVTLPTIWKKGMSYELNYTITLLKGVH